MPFGSALEPVQFTHFSFQPPAIIDAVNSLSLGDNATVQTNFEGSNAHFTFGIPRGNDGPKGADGAPGEVSNAARERHQRHEQTNSAAMATLDTPFASDPPSIADLETMRAKVNELELALRR